MLKYLLVLTAAFALNAQEGPKGPPPGNRPPRPQLTEEQKHNVLLWLLNMM
jgi:hypothetical protein